MLFNSLTFAFFLPFIFILYWRVFDKYLKVQNIFILVSSYVFYGWWDWRFLSLIALSTIVDYYVGLGIYKQSLKNKKKRLLLISIFVNLGLLGLFKYYNFFVESWVELWANIGYSVSPHTISIVLPVGISFYTFQTLSYSIDIYRGKIKPTNDLIAFGAFVSFFPQLVAGPIERAANLLPQFAKKRTFNYAEAVDGLRQILWGLFKKIVIADSCATMVNQIFDNPQNYNGSALFLGAVLFAFQIYGDFSGYSDIAIGTARLFGFNLMRNFAFPYFSRDIAEFWRRWHISLSSWFKDYLYIPLGGSRGNTLTQIRNIFVIFLVSGFWHGANWTFIVWGALNAIYFIPLQLFGKNRQHIDLVAKDKNIPSIAEVFQMIGTFILVTFGWIFFRASNIESALDYIAEIFSVSLFEGPNLSFATFHGILIVFIIAEWIQRDKLHVLEFNHRKIIKRHRYGVYYILIGLIMLYSGHQQEFIYFQF